VSGTINVNANASDGTGVTRVELFLDGGLLGTDTAAPYSVAWDTRSSSAGGHTLLAKAYDAAGNVGTSATVNVTVSNSSGTQYATYDGTLRVPKCGGIGSRCESGTLLNGRANLGPESNAPNTLQGTCADGTSGTYHVDESADAIAVATVDGTPMAPGKQVRVEVKVWAYSGYTSDKLDIYYAANASSPVWTFIATLTPTNSGVNTLAATYTLPAGSLQAVRASFRYGGSAAPCPTGGYNDRDDLAFSVGP
jgi:bacterial leucyl aminopeptidase